MLSVVSLALISFILNVTLSESIGLSTTKHFASIIRGGSAGSYNKMAVDWRFFVAGGICCAVSHGITTPIDVVKTRMQTDPDRYTGGVVQAAADIVKTEGVGFLLAGLGPTVVGYGVEGAMQFGLYEMFKVWFISLTASKIFNFLLAGILAGAIGSVVLCPMEDARIKMVGDEAYAHDNMITAFGRIFREQGILSTFTGLPAMLLKQMPYTMSKQVSFDLFAAMLYAISGGIRMRPNHLKWAISIGSAFLASVLSCLCSQPGDMVLTTTFNDHEHRGFREIVGSIFSKHGLAGFFIGTKARLALVVSVITSQLVLYDIVKHALGLPTTGSH